MDTKDISVQAEIKAVEQGMQEEISKLAAISAEQLFPREEYDRMLAALTAKGVSSEEAARIATLDDPLHASYGEREEWSAPAVGDLFVRVEHRPFRIDPTKMIYIFNLDQVSGNLYNDDLYWRSEPVKFCHGAPTYEEALAAVQKLLDYRLERWESKSKPLNIAWDPKQPDFDS